MDTMRLCYGDWLQARGGVISLPFSMQSTAELWQVAALLGSHIPYSGFVVLLAYTWLSQNTEGRRGEGGNTFGI